MTTRIGGEPIYLSSLLPEAAKPEEGCSNPLFFEKVPTDLATYKNSLSKKATLYGTIDIVAKVMLAVIALVFTAKIWASSTVIGFIFKSILGVGLGLICYSGASLLFFEKAELYLKKANYVNAIIEKSKFFETNPEELKAFCRSHEIDLRKAPDSFDQIKQILLLSELACKQEEIDKLILLSVADSIKTPEDSTKKNEEEISALRYSFGKAKSEAAALLAFLQNPSVSPVEVSLFLNYLRKRYIVLPTERVDLGNDTIDLGFLEITIRKGMVKNLTFEDVRDFSLQELAKQFTPSATPLDREKQAQELLRKNPNLLNDLSRKYEIDLSTYKEKDKISLLSRLLIKEKRGSIL